MYTSVGMGHIQVSLKEVLYSRGISAYRLAEEIDRQGSGLTRGAVYNIVSGRTKPSLDSLAVILDALSYLAYPPVTVCDLLEYIEDRKEVPQPTGRPSPEASAKAQTDKD